MRVSYPDEQADQNAELKHDMKKSYLKQSSRLLNPSSESNSISAGPATVFETFLKYFVKASGDEFGDSVM